ncbi:hypothetical protein EMIHUDRAFT_253861, partial [Emiliania huxleyi CCMP1516]
MFGALACIVIVELCERIGLNTLVSTMKSWLQNQGFSNADSSSVHQIFTLLSFSCCFLGGWLAETKFGRYKTESVPLFLFGVLVLVALGTGGIKPNISPFGADQIDPATEGAEAHKSSFFMYLYLTVNVGCLVAFGFLANGFAGRCRTLAPSAGLPGYIAIEDGFFFCYVLTAGLMATAVAVFFAGTPIYRKESFECASRPVLGPFFSRILEGRGTAKGKISLLGWVLLPTIIVLSILQVFVPWPFLTTLSLAADLLCIGCLCVAHRDNSWLGKPDAVTRCLDIVPVVVVGNVTFDTLYNTMFSYFYEQGCQMDTRVGSDGMQLNAAFFNLGSSIAVVFLTPVIEKAMRSTSGTFKVMCGIFMGAASQLVAAVIEYHRRQAE